jgi:hypothetical protein
VRIGRSPGKSLFGSGNKLSGCSSCPAKIRCLCILALLGEANLETTKQAVEKITVKNEKNWKTENIGVTLFEKRNLLFKKAG